MFDKDENKIKEEAGAWMKENGVDPASHQIEYITLKLPY